MTLVALVEGQSGVASMPVLLRRLAERRERYDVIVARPIRFKRSQIEKDGELERFIQIASRDRAGVGGIIVVLDVDDACAAMLGPALVARAEAVTEVPVRVVCAVREFEGWLIAESASLARAGRLAESSGLPEDPESVRDAKGRVSRAVPTGRSYVAVADQAGFAGVMRLEEAEQRSASFRKLVRGVDALLGLMPSVRS